MRSHRNIRSNAGFSMVEVLVTLIIILVALLGIAALQARAQVAELEAQQRAQALILMSDIVDRINANRETVSCFALTTNIAAGTPFIGADGTGHLGSSSCTASTSAYNTLADDTITALDNLLQGNTETVGGSNVGAMIGARACVSYDSATEISGLSGTGLYTVVVTWQGMADLVAPAASCAVGLYGDETKRRAVSTTFRIADLL
ncbi:MAG: type IV pilus modification protein PilV [Gammaproteobacteria bacterium]|nr:type IV pilus modification protein PilV [Gammaproteobacteria bacterium]